MAKIYKHAAYVTSSILERSTVMSNVSLHSHHIRFIRAHVAPN